MSEPRDGGAGPAPGPADYAYACVGAYVAGGRASEPPGDAFYERRAACFVTLKKHGELRGCIGTLEPAETSLGREIARNAHSSALRDPRFPPVTGDELESLTCSVDVLDPSEACELADLDPQAFGVIVEAGFRRGVLLPALAGVDTVDTQVSIACQKAGIAADQSFDVRRFKVTRYRQGDAPAVHDGGGCAPGDD
jgi:AmmeMemoRadiSam system protein A